MFRVSHREIRNVNDHRTCCIKIPISTQHAAHPTLFVGMQSRDTSYRNVTCGKPDCHVAISADIFCPNCAYNLRGSVSDRCSECGYSLANIRSPICQIPWPKRRERGRLRAYWQTVWMVTFRDRRLCEEVARPVSHVDAQAFRWATVLHAYLPVLLATILVYLGKSPETVPPADFYQQMFQMIGMGTWPTGLSFADRAYAEVWPVVILHACFLLFLVAATGVPSYFFHPRGLSAPQQNRVVALSYYGTAPLALTCFLAILAGGVFVYADTWPVSLGVIPAILLVALILLAWLLNLDRIARRTMPHLKTRRLLIATCVPLLWIGLVGLTLICLPSVVLYVLVVTYSLL